KPAASKRVEVRGAAGLTAKEGDLLYIGWRTKLTFPVATTTNAVFQWKAYDNPGSTTPLQQNYPIVLKTTMNELRLGYAPPGEQPVELWSTAFVPGTWYTFVLGIKVSADPTAGFIEFWFDGQPQALGGGTMRYTARTLDADLCDPKWGVYGAAGTDAT